MTTLSDYLLKERSVESADSIIVELDNAASVAYPASRKVMFHLVLDGSVFVRLNKTGQTEELGAGEYALLFYGDAHGILGSQNPSKQTHVIGQFESGDEPGLLKVGHGGERHAQFVSCALSLIHPAPNYVVSPIPGLLPFKAEEYGLYSGRALLTDMAQIKAACHGAGASAYLNALANLCLFDSVRQVFAVTRQVYSAPFKLGNNIAHTIRAAVKIMQTHPEKHWTVEKLASEIGLSRSSFAAKFRAHVGVSPMEFLTDIRMKYAAELLRNNRDVPLWDISRRVGYEEENSFARVFKKHFGISPRAYSEKTDIR